MACIILFELVELPQLRRENLMDNEILTVDEVAAYLKLAKKTVYKLVAEKQIPAFRVGKFWRFKKSEIEHWINKCQEYN